MSMSKAEYMREYMVKNRKRLNAYKKEWTRRKRAGLSINKEPINTKTQFNEEVYKKIRDSK